jgi:Capsule polysaccharide biosynthesis protein
MRTVLLLSRGERLSALFAALARELSKKYRIVAIHRAHKTGSVDDPKHWAGITNLISYDLGVEIPLRATEAMHKRAAEIEEEIGLNLYSSASNYLLYRRFAKDYFKTWSGLYGSEDELLEEYVGAYSLISEIFDRHQPSLVFCETPDIISHRVAQTIAYRRGVFALGTMFNNLFGDGIVSFTHGCNRRNPLLEYFYRHRDDISPESWAAADALMVRLCSNELHAANYVEDHKEALQGRKVAEIFDRVVRRLKSPMPIAERYAQLKRAASIYVNRRWLNRHLRCSMPTGPYVLVSLHYQPEASTCMVAPRWVDQDYVIEQAAINAPSGIRIAVKENPKGFGFRGKAYYSRLLDLSNVDLIHPLVSNDQLIRDATAILSIAGTVGIEGIALGKKVAVLAQPSYDIYEGVRKIDHPAEIFGCLADRSWNPDKQVDERRAFLAAMAQSVFHIGPPQKATPWPRPEIAGPNYAHALDRFLKFIDRTKFTVECVPVSL